ncbi:MAG: 3-deoxy-D-manno-octulosonic acid transferase [Betaproteobacteria bacterium]|nr:3-deoxy-D-manno-octulosonic acid transferase [Betaproteobacteria bacterium]
MGWLDLFRSNRTPAGMAGSSIVIAQADTLERASAFLQQLHQRFGNLSLAILDGGGSAAYGYPSLTLSGQTEDIGVRLRKLQPQRLIVLGLGERHIETAQAAGCPVFWINARDEAIGKAGFKAVTVSHPLPQLPSASVTGDPLAAVSQLPALSVNTGICQRFKEQREGNRWLGYFAGTGEDEEAIAFQLFNRAIRYKMGMMLLAPRDPARCEPVYRDSLRYRLQTIRHRRLSTSYVPIKTRVYYVEDAQPLADLYACADFVVAGGTLHANAQTQPDLITPMQHGRPILVGPAGRGQPLLAAALEAGMVLAGNDEEAVFAHMRQIIDTPDATSALTRRAQEWLSHQPGAAQRVLAALG